MKDDREQMVYEIKERYGLDSPNVLSVMLQIPREEFVSARFKDIVYHDGPVSIGYGQTMSQPYTVAFMTHLLVSVRVGVRGGPLSRKATEGKKVLEIGTGSGYQAAVLSKLFKEVYTIEIVPELARKARNILKKLKFDNVHVKVGSGEWGWPGKLKFDAIIVTAAIKKDVPEALFEQLKVGGVLVAPIGKGTDKVMTRYIKLKNGGTKKLKKETFGIFHFVPFVEEATGPEGEFVS
ncbi:MAG: Protein-L-isoaspartate O-methyltransferase [Candidatus Woesebacteria bacterium GW2011_GWB1_39_10b]|uniref:Protein-L-isoaspartate O-methyltransferase n=2 Tax=Candidatus Woeseibacteriota TaxID=1752722 RepID=A0A0G0N7U6_9BACT|nr:MAG: Protein-L-isoaspartate O-methyltransferase [Microgenomates group bacterium GW2011_GWC1_38_12]KKQ94475.1 MAG: Protein-L-isoaspartate O-methyltransferase [Candidatus Woesebacteria bacterium GW2011_GWB1_39_10b]KKR12224.1 MAG: Protein-L-isoaspartate O-methyltransferase [Candidatus Woesebacteria bacterium GW2011_GWA1_39_21b]